MDIQITTQERAQNVAFQIKQLLVAINQLKPQVASALAILNGDAEGVSAPDVKTALGDNVDEITKRLDAINGVL